MTKKPSGPRACENWIKSFLEWTVPRSEAPESLLVWSGLFALATVLKRKVYIPRKYLGSWSAYPTTYVMFVGPPGVVRKTTTAGYVEALIHEMNSQIPVTDPGYVTLGPTSGSRSKVVENLTKTIDGSMTVIAGEFGNLVSVGPEEMYDLLSRLFDNPENYTHSTRQHGDEKTLNPSFNLLGCTTPDWIAENSGYMLGGGFAARTIFVFENAARQRKLFYHLDGMDYSKIEGIGKNLVKDLIRVGKLKGEFSFQSDEIAKDIEKWYKQIENFQGEKGTETFQARKHVHVLRTAMLLSVAERDDLVITRGHYEGAKTLIEDVEKKLGRGLSAVGKNPHSAAYYRVLDFIAAQGKKGIDKGKVQAFFWSDMTPMDLSQVFEVLKAAGEIEEIASSDGKLKLRAKQ